jgi:hypothetical protein
MLTLGDGVCPGLMAVVAQIPVVVPPEGMSWFLDGPLVTAGRSS